MTLLEGRTLLRRWCTEHNALADNPDQCEKRDSRTCNIEFALVSVIGRDLLLEYIKGVWE